MKTLKNLDLDLSFTGNAAEFYDFLKANDCAAGKKPIADLYAGKRDEVKGFYFIEGTVDELVVDVIVALPAPVEVEAAAETFTESQVAAAVEAALESGVEVVTEKAPVEAAPAPVKAPKVIKASAARGKIKPVRKDTKIAKGLELLLAGTTQEVLAGSGIGDDVVDFVNRRVTKRGYGVAVGENGLSLVMPEGVTAIVYSGA